MAIQEKLSSAFDSVKGARFGEASADKKLIEAVKVMEKGKGPSKLDTEQSNTLLALDILRSFSTAKGLNGLTKALDVLEAQHPIASLGASGQTDIDTIGAELARQANKFQAELGGDASLIKDVGLLVKEKKWGDAAALIRTSISEAQTRNEIDAPQATKLNDSLTILEGNNITSKRSLVGELEKEQRDLRDPSTGEISKQLGRVDKVETAIARRYVNILKEATPPAVDVNTEMKLDTAVVKEVDTKTFIKSLSTVSKDISSVDVRRLQYLQEEAISNWSDLDSGINLEKWSRGDEDKQRVVREANLVASHVLYLEKKGDISLTAEQKLYLKEIQNSTSATKRAWAEESLSEGEASMPTEAVSPEENRERKARAEGIEQLVGFGNAKNYVEWSKNARRGDPRGMWTDVDEFAGEKDAVGVRLEFLSDPDNFSDGKPRIEIKGGQVVWLGDEFEFFEEVSGLARDVSAIVPEVNQIPFSRSPKARLYQMLMESEALAGKRGDLAWAKDAVFRLYTMGYVKEALWKNGGDVESFSRAALGLLGQGGDESVYSSLNHFHESIKARNSEGEAGEKIIDIDLRDLLDFSEQYSSLKDGKRSWLNAISGGELNSNGDATSQPARKEFFLQYMKWTLDKQFKMKEISATDRDRKMRLIGNDINQKEFKETFDIYGEYYTNLVKVMQSIHLRYGQVAVNQSLEKGSFEFCSPPGGEAPYKLHKNSVFKFVTRYVPNNKFGQFLDGNVDVGMTSTLAYSRKETLPHFVLDHSAVAANPGADRYFFSGVDDQTKDAKGKTRRQKMATQFVNFWKPAMFEYENHVADKNEIWKNVRDTDDMRMIEDVVDRAKSLFGDWKRNHPERLEFVKEIDYSMLSNASGHDFNRIFTENNITDPNAKFMFMIENFGYRYLEWNGLRSKRVGDLYGKYIPKNYAPLYGAAIKLGMNATNDEAISEAATNIDAFTGGSDFISDIDKVVEKMNKRTWTGIRLPKTSFGKDWEGVTEKGEHSRVDLDGKFEFSIKGILPGGLDRTSLAGYYLRHRDPEWTRPILWQQAYERGQMKPEVFEKRMLDYKGEMYFGPKIGNTNIRWGHILPLFLARGWFIDKWHLDIDDFWWITEKANKKAWEEVKKALGIK